MKNKLNKKIPTSLGIIIITVTALLAVVLIMIME